VINSAVATAALMLSDLRVAEGVAS
jgi:hypothetical protein